MASVTALRAVPDLPQELDPHAFVEGDEQALEALYANVSSLVYTLAVRALGSADDAEDVTQQTFVSAWQGRSNFDPKAGELRGWVVGIARKRIADALEKRSRESRKVDALVDASRDRQDGREDIDRVLIAYELKRLGDPRATIMNLAFLEGHTHEQVAEKIGLPLGTVKTHIRTSVIALRRRLEVADVAS